MKKTTKDLIKEQLDYLTKASDMKYQIKREIILEMMEEMQAWIDKETDLDIKGMMGHSFKECKLFFDLFEYREGTTAGIEIKNIYSVFRVNRKILQEAEGSKEKADLIITLKEKSGKSFTDYRLNYPSNQLKSPGPSGIFAGSGGGISKYKKRKFNIKEDLVEAYDQVNGMSFDFEYSEDLPW